MLSGRCLNALYLYRAAILSPSLISPSLVSTGLIGIDLIGGAYEYPSPVCKALH